VQLTISTPTHSAEGLRGAPKATKAKDDASISFPCS